MHLRAPSALRLSGICLASLGDVARFTHFVSHISVMPHPRIYLELAEYIVGQGPPLRRVMTRQSLHYARVQLLVGQHLCLTVPQTMLPSVHRPGSREDNLSLPSSVLGRPPPAAALGACRVPKLPDNATLFFSPNHSL